MKRGGWGRVREAPAYHELQSAVASKTPPQPPSNQPWRRRLRHSHPPISRGVEDSATATRHPTVAEGVRAGRASVVAGPF
jgi:hypothetical protein